MPTLTLLKSSRLAPFCIKSNTTSLCPFTTANMTEVDPTWKYYDNTFIYTRKIHKNRHK